MNYPKNEIIWVSIYNKDHILKYIITSKASREYYFIYKFENGEFKKLGKSKNPTELETKYVTL